MNTRILPVAGYEDMYEVSTKGDVWSLKRGKRKLLLGCVKGNNGRYVDLCKHGVIKQKRVATLVLETFIGPRPIGMLACHQDGDSSNDTIDDLYWGTYTNNNSDTVRHGTHKGPVGEPHHWSKLSTADVNQIRILYKNGWTQRMIADRFNITQSNVSRILNYKTRCKG